MPHPGIPGYPATRAFGTGIVMDPTGFPVFVGDGLGLQKSRLGIYFFGRTGELAPTSSNGAWARLRNPPGSEVNVHVASWTVSNESQRALNTSLFLGEAILPGTPVESAEVSTPNRVVSHDPHAQIEFVTSFSGAVSGGINPVRRRIPGQGTHAEQEDGKIILGPGHDMAIVLDAATGSGSALVAFSWWEEPVAGSVTGP